MKLVRLIETCSKEICSEAYTGKYFSDNFPVQNGLKQPALLPLLFNFALECASRKVKENQVGLKFNGTHKILAYADDVNLLGDNIDTMKIKTETVMDTNQEVGSRNKHREN
jgi:hypothetical protein